MSESVNITMTTQIPEGFEGGTQEYADEFCENARFQATGAFITGQIGGAEPAADIGLWIDGGRLKYWNGAKYVPIITVPIGTVMDYPSGLTTPPEDWLFCDVSPAASLVLIEDYPELYAVIGRLWTSSTDDAAKFRLPCYAGRTPVGAGTGQYDPKVTGVEAGAMTPHSSGDIFGHEWLTANTPTQSGAPSGRFSSPFTKLPIQNKTIYHGVSQPTIVVRKIIKYR